MESVSRSFANVPQRQGLVVGVLPGDVEGSTLRSRPGYPNPYVEIAIQTHLPLSGERGSEPLSRNHINVLSSDVIVVLPGGAGTESEARLAFRYGRPCFGFLDENEMPDLVDLERSIEVARVERFVRQHAVNLAETQTES